MKKRLYTAYGSNLNLSQMAMRCPTAKLVGIGTIQDYELQFKGRPQGAFATIAPKEGAMVPVAVWALEPKDEQALDWYEGYPSHYFKQDIRVQMSEVEIQAMVYIMDLKQEFGLPSLQYYQTVREGYEDCGLDATVLDQAIMESAKAYFANSIRQSYQESLFTGQEDLEEEDLNEAEEWDESDPFYFSEGPKL